MKEEGQYHYVLIKDSSTVLYNNTLHLDKKPIYRYCFQSFGTTQTLKRHVNDCSEMNHKQMIKAVKNVKLLYSKIIQEK